MELLNGDRGVELRGASETMADDDRRFSQIYHVQNRGRNRNSSKNAFLRSERVSLTHRIECFESLIHAILGETYPTLAYTPPWGVFEAMPLVSYITRCKESRRRLASKCLGIKPQNKDNFLPAINLADNLFLSGGSSLSTVVHRDVNEKKSNPSRFCRGLHGDMLGEDLAITTVEESSTVEERDHSCCRQCRALQGCTFWVRASNTRDCWLKTNFIGYGPALNRRGSFLSEFRGVFLG